MEYAIVLLVISAAAAAINTAYGSSEDLIERLAHNIRNTNITSETTYVPPNSIQSNTWGVIPMDGSPLIHDGEDTKISTNPSSINPMPEWDPDEERVKGKHLPVAYFMANQPSTFDILTVYDYSYDLDETDSGQLKRFWKMEKTGNLTGADADYDNSDLTCDMVENCSRTRANSWEGFPAYVWNTKGFENGRYTGWHSTNGKSNFENSTERDEEILAENYCYGTASECLPKHLSNGYYTISLIVIDQDQNETDVYQQSITIRSEGLKYGYVYEYTDPIVVSRVEMPYEGDEEIKLVDHQFGTVTDLYGVKHPVIEMNMLRSSRLKRYKVTTSQFSCQRLVIIETDTGKTVPINTNPKCINSNDNTGVEIRSETIVDGTGSATSTDGSTEGNLWLEEKMQKNKWTIYVYDKRSLFNKRFIGKPSNTTLSDLTTTTTNGTTKTNASGGHTYISNPDNFQDSDFNSLRGNTMISDSNQNELIWTTTAGNTPTTKRSNLTTLTENTGSTTQMHIDINNSMYPTADKTPATRTQNGVKGYNNTGYTSDSVPNNKEAAGRGVDFEDHETHPAMSNVVYYRKCIKGCENTAFLPLNDNDLPDVDIVQVQSNYLLTDDISTTNATPTGNAVKTTTISEPFSDTIYRDTNPDFSDDSRMYQLRTLTRGVSNPTENNLEPDFISVRLSLNDYYGYNPGANLNDAKLNGVAVGDDIKSYYLSTPNINDTDHEPYVITNHDFNNNGLGCNECTEPNFNTDGKVQWTEYRTVDGSVSPTETYTHGRCGTTFSYPSHSYSIDMDARTRQYNFVEHAAFDWVYEYSGEGDGSARKATDGTAGNRTLKIRRAHWHTLGRKLDQITMGRYTDPYTVATRNNNPYKNAPTSSNFSSATKDIRFLQTNNAGDGKDIITASDTQTISSVGHSDSSGRSDYWRVLKGSASDSTSTGWMSSCTIYGSCSCGGSRGTDYYVKTTTKIKLSYTGLDPEVVTYELDYDTDSDSWNNCSECPKTEGS